MTMFQLLFGRIPHLFHGDIENERFSCERMVAVDDNRIILNRHHGVEAQLTVKVGMENQARRNFFGILETLQIHFPYQFIISCAETFLRGQGHFHLMSDFFALQGFLQTGSQGSGTLNVTHKFSIRAFEKFPLLVPDIIVNGDNGVFTDDHSNRVREFREKIQFSVVFCTE